MIVKNEARVIERCLASVRPHIDCWSIVDTGSSDGTQQLIGACLADLPGELNERPWKNFGHNRSEALELARAKADYILVIDADEELIGEGAHGLPQLVHDEYLVLYRLAASSVTFFRTTLIRSALPWRYEGVLHEHLACAAPHSVGKVHGLAIHSHSDGARNVDPRKKYEEDARILEQALRDEPNNARYAFYLAQSYRDSQQAEKAIAAYEQRVAMGGWAEEVWYSLLQIASLKQRTKQDFDGVLAAYLRAYQSRPSRAESLCELAALCRGQQKWALAELFARAAAGIPRPSDILFVDDAVYAWRVTDELAIATYYVGNAEEGLRLNLRLLSEGKLPERERARVEQNLNFCKSKQAEAPRAPRTQRNEAKRARRARR